MTGRRLNLKHIKAGFRDYIEATTDNEVTNDIKGQTHGYVSLGTSGNCQGSQVCFDLKTGRVVLRRVIQILPMSDSVIQVNNNWGKSQSKITYVFLLISSSTKTSFSLAIIGTDSVSASMRSTA